MDSHPFPDPATGHARPPLAVWLAGGIGWDDHAAIAERLAGEVGGAGGRLPTLVVCELEPQITIGRLGSRTDVALTDDELRSRRLTVRFTGRGGGAVLHGPGQVFVSLVASLADLGLGPNDTGGYLARFLAGLEGALAAVRCGTVRHAGVDGIFGRTGLLAAVGVAIRRGVVCHGAFVNVCPPLELHHRIVTIRRPDGGPGCMGSIEADLQRRVRLQDVRTALVQHLGAAFGFPRTHLNAGFPYLNRVAASTAREAVGRVG